MQALERELGIKVGETTPDLQFSITPTRCLGACGIAPVIAIDGEQYGNLTPEKLKATPRSSPLKSPLWITLPCWPSGDV